MGKIFTWTIALVVAMTCGLHASGQSTARDRGVKDVSSTPSSAFAPASALGPYYALVVGNDNYQHLEKLQTAVNDAQAVSRILEDRFGFTATVLYNATRADILNAIEDFRGLPERSNLLIYYAGHGHKDVDAHRAYWLPVDAERNRMPNWINAADILDAVRAIPARHVLIISDSCFSGDLNMRDAQVSLQRRAVTQLERSAMLAKVVSLKSRHIMSSGGDEPVADVGTGGHSVFAAALLQSLNDMEEDEFTGEALLTQRVKPRVAGRSAQTPQYAMLRDSDADLGDFVFYRTKTREAGLPLHEPGEEGWGFLTDLHNAHVYDLKSDNINIGRNVPGIQNDISFSSQFVSRRHLIINRAGHIDDLRTTNGTTINAQALPYGVGGKLADNDILVLGKSQPLQFHSQKPSATFNVPSNAWGMLIDGQSRSYLYLTGAGYSLSLRNGKIALAPGISDTAMLKLRRLNARTEMLISINEWRIIATERNKESDYTQYIMGQGTWTPLLDSPLLFAKLSSDQKKIMVEGPAFQIVLFE
jgi:uncharacterized caspase-like protein